MNIVEQRSLLETSISAVKAKIEQLLNRIDSISFDAGSTAFSTLEGLLKDQENRLAQYQAELQVLQA